MSSHLTQCPECARLHERTLRLRAALRNLPQPAPPAQLTAELRVIASRERVRRLVRASLRARAADWGSRARLWMDNLMRPVALPFAGGLFSAVVLFGMLVPSVLFPRNPAKDVPIVGLFPLYQEPTVQVAAPFGFNEDDFVVEVVVDQNGRMIDYSITEGQCLIQNVELRRSIENTLLFTRYAPGLSFGQPVAGKVFVSFRKSHIDVGS